MKQQVGLVVLLLAVGLTTGCIEFVRQTMSWRHDTAADTLYIFQDYEGIFGGDDPAKLSADELSQWTSVLSGGRTFFFNNWITEFNRAALEEMRAKPAGELDADPAYETSLRAIADLALANVRVENVGLYLNQEKQLCGAQRVTVKNVSKVLAALNKVVLFAARTEGSKEERSAAERELLLKFFRSGQAPIRLEGNRLEVRWPVLEEDYTKFKNESPEAAAIRAAGGSMRHEDGVLILAVGAKDSMTSTLTLPFSDKRYVGNAMTAAEKQGVLASFDAGRATREFLAGGR